MRTTGEIAASDVARLLLWGHGLCASPERSRVRGGAAGLIRELGFVQVDSINVVERAHHHILWTRWHGYRSRMLAKAVERDRAAFEHWTHDASVIPVESFRYWRPRFARAVDSKWWRERLGTGHLAAAERVLARIAAEGPLRARDFEDEAGRNGARGGWWDWKPDKAVLEYLWRAGKLMIARREGAAGRSADGSGFEKVYDLTERVIPEAERAAEVGEAEVVEWACRGAMARLSVATPREVAAFWHTVSAHDGAAWCKAAAERGEVVPVGVRGADGRVTHAFAVADWRDRLARSGEPPGGMRLLSPFEPVLRDRKRAERVFGFAYTFEAFTPAAKRKFGYYVLPILEGDRLVGRLDPVLDRKAGVLSVRGVWWERGVRPTRARRSALGEAVERYAAMCGAEVGAIGG